MAEGSLRILVAGATGAIGRFLVPELVRRGHTVGGLARHPESVASIGAEPLKADALDRDAVVAAFERFRPEVVIHELTQIPHALDMRRFDEAFAATNFLRTRGTDNLVTAARAVKAKRLVAQSFCGWPLARTGDWVKDETAPLDPDPPRQLRPTLEAMRYLEHAVLSAVDLNPVVLRYAGFYGPGTQLAKRSAMAAQVSRRKLPIVGQGAGVWSFVHIADAAVATALAAEHAATGVYNIADDAPAPVAHWLPVLADAMGAKRPRHVPLWLARIVLPDHVVALMTEIRGGSNAKARRELGWEPRVRSWRQGFYREFA